MRQYKLLIRKNFSGIAALLHLPAADYVQSLPEGLNTIIMENGKKLSVGQRQRIAFCITYTRLTETTN